jgi:hypothetical protein
MNIPVIAMKSHSLEKSFSSIPRIIKNKAPHYAPNIDPKSIKINYYKINKYNYPYSLLT